MKHSSESFLRRALKCQSGQAYISMILMIPLILGVGGLSVDVGHAYACYRQLQASTDAAALAAGLGLPSGATVAESDATALSSVAGNDNAFASLNTPSATTGAHLAFQPYCVTTVPGVPPCGGALTYNAIRVTQSVTVPTYFIRALEVLGIQSAQSITLNAQATAVVTGGMREPDSVAIIFDTTSSMTNTDGGANCTGSKEQCSLAGAQIMMSEFSPCTWGETNCGAATNGLVTNSYDEISFFTFPAQSPTTQATKDYACPSSPPTEIAYPDSKTYTSSPLTAPLTTAQLAYLVSRYQVVPLSSDYRVSDGTIAPSPLNLSSKVVKAAGGNSYWGGTTGGCNGMQANGGEGTYFAGAIYTANQYLVANTRANTNNIIILFSDGGANGGTMSSSGSNLNASGVYPAAAGECKQAIATAAAAQANGTEIFVVGYGVATTGGCGTTGGDSGDGSLTPCQVLQQIASPNTKRPHFYVDSSSTPCAGATTVTMNGKTNSISGIFTQIVDLLSKPKLVLNGAT
jgi:Flp pilus assembly protein TadG